MTKRLNIKKAIKKPGSLRKALNIKDNVIVSCHGGHGMSSQKVLKHLLTEHGSLPFNKKNNHFVDHLRHGEIMFTYSLIQLGYKFGVLPRDTILIAPAYDLMRGLEIKKNPTLYDLLYYYFGLFVKKPLYPVLKKIGILGLIGRYPQSTFSFSKRKQLYQSLILV